MTFDQWIETDQGRAVSDWAILKNANVSAQAFVRRLRTAFNAGVAYGGTIQPEDDLELSEADVPE